MLIDAFLKLRPFACHTTALLNLERIRRTRMIESTRRLFELAECATDPRLGEPRRGSVQLTIDGTTVSVRDQDPLNVGAIGFEAGWDLPRFVEYLNGFAFFWPGAGRPFPIEYIMCMHLTRLSTFLVLGCVAAFACASTDERSAPGRGKIHVLEFFAEYCAPCKVDLPKLQDWADRNPDVVVIGFGEDESEAKTLALARRLGLRFRIVHDTGWKFRDRYGVSRLPTKLVTDRYGNIRWRSQPSDGVAELDQIVNSLR